MLSLAEVVVNGRRKLPHEERLALAAAFLERLDEERFSCGDPTQGKAVEERIVSRELLDLELQEFDAEVERLLAVTENLLAGTRA
jgi:hypothetical protein